MSRRRNPNVVSDTPVKKIQKDINREKKLKRKKRRRRNFKRFILILIFAGIIGGGVWFDRSPYSRIKAINVDGNVYHSNEEIIEAVGLKENDRLVSALLKKVKKGTKIPGVAKIDVKLYYTKGLVTLSVQEYPVVGLLKNKEPMLLFKDNSLINSEKLDNMSVPYLYGFNGEIIEKFPKFSDKLSRMDVSSYNSISEIHIVEEPLEEIYFKLIMNNGYFVFTNLDNLLLMDYYAEIVSGIQNGDKPDNRCIYFLDYGRTDDNQSAVAKPCK